MFGVPFVLQVPREGLDHDRLYQLIVTRMKRYLKTVKEQEQPEGIESDAPPSLQTSNPNGCESEMETDENHVHPDLENGNESKPAEVNGTESVVNSARAMRLFTMDSVNLNGNTSLGRFKQNGKSLSFEGSYNFTRLMF